MHEDDDFFDEEIKSKSQIKKEMHALQDFGVTLSELTSAQRSQLPLDEELTKAIEQYTQIKSNSAKKRQMQFIGKLLRGSDYEAIQHAYDTLMEATHRSARLHPVFEQWRDQLIEADEHLSPFIAQFPQCDRQQLRQLIRNARRERDANLIKKEGAPPNKTHFKKLFVEIRTTIEAHQEQNS